MTKRRVASRAAHIGGVDVRKRVDGLARAVAEIEVAIRRAEEKIVGDAADRIHRLREEAFAQLDAVSGDARRALHGANAARQGRSDPPVGAAAGEPPPRRRGHRT